jgi:hypothetical protein
MSHDAALFLGSSCSNPRRLRSSLPIHPYHRNAGFQPGAAKGKEKYTYKDYRATNEHVNGLLVASTNLWQTVDRISSDISQVANCALSSDTPTPC